VAYHQYHQQPYYPPQAPVQQQQQSAVKKGFRSSISKKNWDPKRPVYDQDLERNPYRQPKNRKKALAPIQESVVFVPEPEVAAASLQEPPAEENVEEGPLVADQNKFEHDQNNFEAEPEIIENVENPVQEIDSSADEGFEQEATSSGSGNPDISNLDFIEPQIDSQEEFDTPETNTDQANVDDGADNSGPSSLTDTVLNTSANIKEILSGFDDQDEDLIIVFGSIDIKEFFPNWKAEIQWIYVEQDMIVTGEDIPEIQVVIEVPGTELQGCENVAVDHEIEVGNREPVYADVARNYQSVGHCSDIQESTVRPSPLKELSGKFSEARIAEVCQETPKELETRKSPEKSPEIRPKPPAIKSKQPVGSVKIRSHSGHGQDVSHHQESDDLFPSKFHDMAMILNYFTFLT
jgi:hypothetical protein